jgi:5-methylcytosine-specific restriction endonuclease McrA
LNAPWNSSQVSTSQSAPVLSNVTRCGPAGIEKVTTLDHVVPRSRGGPDTWENLVWAAKNVNQRKGNRLPHEAGLKLLTVPRAPKEVPVTAFIRSVPGIDEWKLFLG